MIKIHVDFETRSKLDIKKVGGWKYAMDPSTEIMCMAVALGDGPVKVFTAEEVRQPHTWPSSALQIVAHSAHFEYAVWHYILVKRFGWPALEDPKHWMCTQARAYMCGLPGTLDGAAVAMKIKHQKDLHGRAAMLKLCKPIGIDVFDEPVYRTDKALYEELYRYCAGDVEVERELDNRLPDMLPEERKIWEFDLVVNRRGVPVDVETATNAENIALKLKATLNKRLDVLTDGAVDSTTRIAAIKKYLASKDLIVASLDKQSVNDVLASDQVSDHLKDVLRVKRQANKSSNAKYKAIRLAACSQDNRVRGMFQYHAATTGRWGGRLVQLHNIPQGFGELAQAEAIDAIKAGPLMFDLLYGDVSMDALSNTIRGMIAAEDEKILTVADFIGIETRVLFWLSGNHSVLDKLRRGLNLYIDMASYIYEGKPIDKHGNPEEYKVGKAAILGCGYGMGWIRFQSSAAEKGMIVSDELSQRAVAAYRTKYSDVRSLWYQVERAAINAIRNPGKNFWCCDHKVVFGMDPRREFLCCRLPSGRYLRYFKPYLKTVESHRGGEKTEIRFRGVDSTTKQFVEQKTWGGKLVENIDQAISRDILAHGAMNCEVGGYPVVLHVHDEVVSEIPLTQLVNGHSVDRFQKLMCDLPVWAKGLPIAAEGWAGARYRK